VQSFVAKFKDEFVAKGKADEERAKAQLSNAPASGSKELANSH
jgi:hypothetical protein